MSLADLLNKGADKTYPCKCGGKYKRFSEMTKTTKSMKIVFKWECDKCGKVKRSPP